MFSNIYYDALHSKVHLWEYIKGKRVHTIDVIDHDYYIADETGKSPIQDIFGRSMLAQKASSKKVITELRNADVYTCEGNLPEDVKFLQKRYGTMGDMQPEEDLFNVAYLDIEVESPKEFPKPSEKQAK